MPNCVVLRSLCKRYGHETTQSFGSSWIPFGYRVFICVFVSDGLARGRRDRQRPINNNNAVIRNVLPVFLYMRAISLILNKMVSCWAYRWLQRNRLENGFSFPFHLAVVIIEIVDVVRFHKTYCSRFVYGQRRVNNDKLSSGIFKWKKIKQYVLIFCL